MPAIASTHPPSTAVSNCSRLLFHGWSNHPAGVMLFNHKVNANAPYPRAEAFAVLFMAALSCESARVSGERARLPTIVDTACVERVTTVATRASAARAATDQDWFPSPETCTMEPLPGGAGLCTLRAG